MNAWANAPACAKKRSDTHDLYRLVEEVRRAGYRRVAGVDEAGRGALAGPVVAASAILPGGFRPAGLKDSKALTARQREKLYRLLRETEGVAIGVCVVGRVDIDRLNILQATYQAMRGCLTDPALRADFVLVDGCPGAGLPQPSRALVGGDASCASIAAASIIAKVVRDRIMVEMDRLYPPYGFACNKGYGTPEHLDALRRFGPCPEHRRSFSPVRQLELSLFPGG